MRRLNFGCCSNYEVAPTFLEKNILLLSSEINRYLYCMTLRADKSLIISLDDSYFSKIILIKCSVNITKYLVMLSSCLVINWLILLCSIAINIITKYLIILTKQFN
jgi:hypothetical protein